MGLDTFASRSPDDILLTEEDVKAFQGADISLCGGIFSGNDGSFRGKVYAEVILEMTEESLYQEWIPPETVTNMYHSMLLCDPEEINNTSRYEITPLEIKGLIQFFKICSERQLGLLGWW